MKRSYSKVTWVDGAVKAVQKTTGFKRAHKCTKINHEHSEVVNLKSPNPNFRRTISPSELRFEDEQIATGQMYTLACDLTECKEFPGVFTACPKGTQPTANKGEIVLCVGYSQVARLGNLKRIKHRKISQRELHEIVPVFIIGGKTGHVDSYSLFKEFRELQKVIKL